MQDIIELDGISSLEELMGNSNYFLQMAVNSWFPGEPELEVKICDCGCIEGDALDVVQFAARRKDQGEDQDSLIPLLVNASINCCEEGKLFLAPISVFDTKSAEYFSRQISLTEETFSGVISHVKPLIDIDPVCFPGRKDLHTVGTAFHVTYRVNSGQLEAVIYSEQCFVVKNAQGLWIPTRHIWN
jgi:hypothetical protein